MRSLKLTPSFIFIGALVGACGQADLQGPVAQVGTSGRGVLQSVSSFGSNPGGLRMFKYVPASPQTNAPLVVAMHACSQTAAAYESAGWNALADQYGFYVLYPEQTSGNNPAGCFNWAGEGYVGPRDTANLERGMGENQSIIQMVDKMVADHGIDADRVFMMGHSGGAAQAALMLALWPDRIAGGGIIAGIPYRCTTVLLEVSTCLNPGIDRMAAQWGDLARMGHPGYAGPWPKVTIWHGDADTTVRISNQVELLEQFTNLYGIDATADATSTVDGSTFKDYDGPGGAPLVQTVVVPGMGHGTPVVPGDGCGQSGAYFLNSGICAVRRMAEFWGLIGGTNPGDTTPPTVNVTAPTSGATVTGDVTVTISASDDTQVASVELFINGALATTLTSAPYQYTWATGALASGQYSLRAVAADGAGNRATDDDTTVTVQSTVTDTQAPTVQITGPADGATVMGQVGLEATATDDYGVAEVEFLVDGGSVGVATAAPFSVAWDASAVAAGEHVIAAQARDAAGNQAEAMITVTVEGTAPVDTTAPVVSITTPADGAEVNDVIRINVEATDDTRVRYTAFLIDGVHSGTGVTPPYSFIWDTRLAETGTHTLTVTAIDPAGNTGQDSITVKVVATPEPDPNGNNNNNNGGGEPSRVSNDRWGCTAAPGAPEQLAMWLVVGLGGLLSRRRR